MPAALAEPAVVEVENSTAITVLFEDEHALVVDKPAGHPVIPGRNNSMPDIRGLLENQQGKKLWVVHRLDAGTSGVLMFAKSAADHRFFNGLFEERLAYKSYLTVVQGNPPQTHGEVYAPLKKANRKRYPVRVDARGKKAHSSYDQLERFRHYSLLRVQPHTGRTHQIRVHMYHLGCPLAIDPLYAEKGPLTKAALTGKKTDEETLLMNRLTLHAQSLGVLWPDGSQKQIEAPMPADMQALLHALRNYDK